MITHVKKNNEVLPVSLNVRALSNFATIQKVPYSDLQSYLAGQLPGSEGTEVERNVALVFCGLKEGARIEKKPFVLTIDDVWDWLMDDQESFWNALNAIIEQMEADAQKLADLPRDDSKKN